MEFIDFISYHTKDWDLQGYKKDIERISNTLKAAIKPGAIIYVHATDDLELPGFVKVEKDDKSITDNTSN